MPNKNRRFCWVKLFTFILLFGLFSIRANAASFNCKKATNWLEKTICSDPELSKLDEQMAKAYQDTLASLSPEGQKETKEYQRQWLKEISYIKAKNDKFYTENKQYPASFHDEAIARDLKDAYEERIEQLQQSLTKFPDRIFRNVYVNHSKADKNCAYFLVERHLSYPQIENPRDENEKSWNIRLLEKVCADFKEESDGNDCTNINDEYRVSFSSRNLISFYGHHYYYDQGAAHGYGSPTISFSWLWKEKRELQASDLFDDKTDWRKKLTALVAEKQKEWEATAHNMTLMASSKDKLFSPNNWVISEHEWGFWLYTHNFADATLITIDWKSLDPYLSKKGHSLIHD
jgi:uncharacterized protein